MCAFITSGGANVGSSQINDGAIINADINVAAAIAQSKIAGTLNGNTDIISVETTAGTTHSLTTVAGQKVIVWAKGSIAETTTTLTLTLKYNGVTKDTVVQTYNDTGASSWPFALVYTETPGAATQNITIETTSGTINNPVIVVIKVKA